MAEGYISSIKLPNNKEYLLKDSEKTDEKVNQVSNTEDKEFPIILKYNNNTTNETNGVKYNEDVTVNPSKSKITATTIQANSRLVASKAISQIITGTGTAGSYTNSTYHPAKWTFNTGLTATDGDIFTIKIPVAGHDYGVFMSVDNGSHYYPVVLNGTGRITTQFPINTYITVIFEPTGSAASMYALAGQTSSTKITVTGGVWRVLNYYDSNSNDTGYYHRRIYPNLKAGGTIHPYSIIMQLPNGKWSGITTTAPNNPGKSNVSPVATGKAANASGFMLGHVLLMYANTTYADANNIGTYNIWSAHTGLIDARYSFNLANSTGNGFVAYTPVYIVGTVSNGLFHLDATKWWTQTLPSSDDGKVYIYIGDAYDWYRLTFTEDKPIYWYKDGAVRLYSGVSEYALSAPLSGISGADDLKAIEAISGTSGLLKKTAANTWTLDTNNYVTSSGITSITIGATSPVQSSTSTAQTGSSASTTISLKDAYGDTKNPYGTKAKNLVLAGPSSGSNAAPTFRSLVAADIPSSILKWQTTTAESTALYDFGVYVNMNNANSSSMTSGNYFNILNVPYRKASGNAKADWGWQLGNTTSNDGRLWYRTSGDNVWGDWQTIAHATQSTDNIGSATQPVYMTAAGVITAGTALEDLAYIAKPTSNTTTTFLRGDGKWTSVTPSISITAGTADNAPKINTTVLGVSGTTAQELTKATTGKYGVTKLSSATNSDSEVLAATPKAIKTLNTKMDGLLAAADAMTFKGTIDSTNGSDAEGSTNRKTLPATHNAGDTYRVAKEGTYAGKYCEIGTLIICVKDGTAAADADWTSVETNEDGAVISSSTSSTNNAIARFDGESGRIIKNSSTVLQDDGTIKFAQVTSTSYPANSAGLSWSGDNDGASIYYSQRASNSGHLVLQTNDDNNETIIFRHTKKADSNNYDGIIINPYYAQIYPAVSAQGSLGGTSYRWKNAYINGTIYIGNNSYTAWNSTTNGSWLTTGEMGIQRTSAGGGFYLESNGQLAARMWLQTLGTASTAESASGADDGTQGALGQAYLALGNAISRGAKNTTAGADNSQGYLRLYGSDTHYTDVTAMTTSSVSRLHPINGIALPNNITGILFRPDSSSYHVHISHQTNGNEALVAATQNAVTSFIFINGEKLADISNSRWQSLTPALQIKNNSVYIGELIPHNTTPSYKFKVNGISYFTDIVNIIGDTNAQIGKGINFSLNDIQYGHIGTNNSGMLGIYGNQSVAIRPSLSATNRGIKIDTDAITPGESNKIDLGTSTLIWKNVYATTFTGDLIGNATAVKQYYTTNSTDAPLQVRSNNKNVYIWQAGHATSESGGFSNNYTLQYYGEGSSPNNYLILKANNSSTVTDAVQIDENGNITIAKTITGTITNSTWTTLLKPINEATAASASTWNIPSGSYQVWGERFSDTRLKYTPEGGTEKTVTDTGDWTMWLSGDGTTNQAKLNMRIDGTYYGTFSGNASSASGIPQTGTSTASWRKILLTGGDAYSAWDTSVTSRTASACQATGVSVQPSTGAMHISGPFTTSSTTASTSSTTGALIVNGGVGVGGQVTAARLAANGSNTSYNLYVNGNALFNIGTNDSTSDKRFLIKGNNKALSFGGGGIYAYTVDNDTYTNGQLNLQYYGGNIQIGNSGTNQNVTGNVYGNFTYHNSIIFNNKTAVKHIEFTRQKSNSGPSYICYPESGELAIGYAVGYDYSLAVFDGNTAIRPGKSDTFDLGSSSYRWKTIYGSNKLSFKNSTVTRGASSTNNIYTSIEFIDKNDKPLALIDHISETNGRGKMEFVIVRPRTDTTNNYFGMRLFSEPATDGRNWATFNTDIIPYTSNNTYTLGDSTIQWKATYSKSFIVDQQVTLQYNSTDDSLDFIFA